MKKEKEDKFIEDKSEQGTEDWFKIRIGKLTASHAQSIGNAGKGLETYVTELMAEYYSIADKVQFSNKDTERGKELEDYAREMYGLEKDIEVKQVGFIHNDFYGCSCDGFVGDEGIIEFKCLNDVGHYLLIRDKDKAIDTKFLWQVQMQLLITKRKWADLVFYSPNFSQSMIIFRIVPDKEKHEALKVGIAKGIELIKNQLKNYDKKI